MNSTLKSFLTGTLWCAGLLLPSCSGETQQPADLTRYVDPYIGTGGHGHVFMGANVPYGMVQVGPTQHSTGWDWCSGYHISDSIIIGFGHQHLSGTGIGDLGDIALMPATGNVAFGRGTLHDPSTGFYSRFSHDREEARAGYYAVHLERYDIEVELTATQRVGFHKYTFPAADEPKVIIDLVNGIGWDDTRDARLVMENDSTLSGYRYSSGWAADQRTYFTMRFSRPIADFTLKERSITHPTAGVPVRYIYAQATFQPTQAGEEIYVKTALSPVSIENAKRNLDAELPGWDFTQCVQAADSAWNKELNKVRITTDDPAKLRTFYTALYHTMVAPSVFCDVNGDYLGTDKQIHSNNDFTNYTTFSLWDTYRAAQPLMTLIHPERCADVAETFLHIFDEQGKLPVWHLVGNETDCMVGNPGIIVLADLLSKGHVQDKEKAFEAMKTSALLDERSLHFLKEAKGYIPSDRANESVAKALEYAIADWCIALTARNLGKEEDYRYFLQRSQAYAHYFDQQTGFMRGRTEAGEFRTPFNPFHSVHREDDYTEGNAWQYTWLVPHDVSGLVRLFGDEAAFTSKLDSLFIVQGDMGAEASPDISGLIGQYAHGNEPSHHIAYLYPFVGQPWKTAEKVRHICTELYSDTPDGLSGNEDVGQMSAWYILSSIGFYPVAPAGGVYVFGSPLFDEAVLQLPGNKTFTIIAHNNASDRPYIQQARLNGQPYTRSYITHDDIMQGGILEFDMGSKPSATFGTAPDDRPVSPLR